METKHTLGPWRVVNRMGGYAVATQTEFLRHPVHKHVLTFGDFDSAAWWADSQNKIHAMPNRAAIAKATGK